MYTMVQEIYDEETTNSIIYSWTRYIDDCWILWKESYGNICNFRQILENLHPSIQFTMDADENNLHFLDVQVYRDGDK